MVKAVAYGEVEVPGAIRVAGREEAKREARRLAVEENELVLLVGNDAWRLYGELASEMRMSNENFYLLEALDPLEARLARLSWGRLLLSRIAYAARRPARSAYSELGSAEKRVTRRALLRGTIVEAAMEYTEKPVEDATLCRNKAVAKYCEECLSACDLEGGCPVSAALCSIELLYLPGYTRSGLHDALRSIGPLGEDGYAVIAPRSAMAELLSALRKAKAPVIFIPVSCPYVASIEELIALHALGMQPLVVEAGWEPSIKRCRESREPYRSLVESDYVKVTGLRLLYAIEEVEDLVTQEKPRPIRVENPGQYLSRGLRPLALAVAKKLGIAADTSSGLSAVLRVDAEKCTLCSACAYECPTNALQVHETSQVSALLFLHDRCIACGYCEEICPEDAIKVSRAINASLIGSWTPLALKESLRCIVCGEPIGAASLIEKTIEKLIQKGFHPEKMPQLLMCETCRQKYSLGMISDEQVDYEALYRVVNRVRRRLGLQPLEPPRRQRS